MKFVCSFSRITLLDCPPPQPRIMITQNILLTCSSLLILVNFLQTSRANQMNNLNCIPSSCGSTHNISFPFRLKDDPPHCGDRNYELACEDNVTSIYLNSQKYHVKAINYQNYTIRLGYVSINNSICSFPKYSVHRYNFTDDYPYRTWGLFDYHYPQLPSSWPINFMSCPYPLKNLTLFTEITDCAKGDNRFDASNSSNGRHSYIMVGYMEASDVKNMCRVDLTVITSWRPKDSDIAYWHPDKYSYNAFWDPVLKNVSLSEIHDFLLHGFELSWDWFKCSKCKRIADCYLDRDNSVACRSHTFRTKLDDMRDNIRKFFKGRRPGDNSGFLDVPNRRVAVALMPILVLIIGLCFAAKIIIGLICVSGFFICTYKYYGVINFSWLQHLRLIVGLIFASRFIILFPCIMWFLIYKFRRRHLSMFEAIEGFLQSDNRLMPIRYSYSDIKNMTRGFREKLGEGGYGAVYKGKLRSGHDVAVKLLGKPKDNGQDFINEIATIGRIHHVNVVKLVGYCAERSKRALVFDFMPNGSLDKYICNREKMSLLNWEAKYQIAIGVARGIEYLHRGCDIQILHFDIKPHNILLDDKFIPKISDFGLAKFCSTEKNTMTLTAARGTIGYVAPELINRGIGRVSHKADVYSFGMLLIEMVGLNGDVTGSSENSSQYFPYWIYDCFNKGKDIEIVKDDENDADDDNDNARKIARKMTVVALWCIQMSPGDRPSMNKVLEMLEGEVERLQIPSQPSQTPQVVVDQDQTWSTCSSDSVSFLCHDAAPSVEITVQDL